MSGVTNIYSQAQENIYTDNLGKTNQTEKGQFNNQNITATQNVDASTKDDECLSELNSAKKAQQEKKKQDKKRGEKLNAVQETAKRKAINEQDQRSRRISKNTAMRLASMNQSISRDLSETIQERSGKLFDGSEEAYQKCFNELDQATLEKACTSDKIAKAIGQFEDVAEQHNALQIVIEVWERKLTNLKGLAQSLSSEKELDAQAKQQDQEALQQQIQELEKALSNVKKAQGNLMEKNDARIKDSYILAPLLREVNSHYNHNITLPPKTFNAFILDKFLPLGSDPAKAFDCLIQTFIEGLAPTPGSAIEHFKHNIEIVKTCLTQELQCCPDKNIATAILNSLRGAQKLETVEKINENLVLLLFSTFANLMTSET